MQKKFLLIPLIIAGIISTGCNNQQDTQSTEQSDSTTTKMKEENVTYQGNNVSMNGFVVYDENRQGPRPAVIVVHEWWGLNDYIKNRARQLADMGYIVMAIDMFGNGKTADNPDSAGKLATPFYQDPQMARERFHAGMTKLISYPQTDTAKIGAIGYCFGGAQVLNMARLGENLRGVVSFHGNLVGVPPRKDLLKAEVLVCHGEADPFVPQSEVDQFKKQMDSIGAKYTFKSYEGALHAFTNPKSTEVGERFKIPVKYDAAADSASWNDMKTFFNSIFR